MRTIAIIGGGFTGTAAAIRLCRISSSKLIVYVVEPRRELGGGLAYGGDDPDHRVNGTHHLLVLFPDDIGHFSRWYEASGASTRDPEAGAEQGVKFVRRTDVRRYLQETLARTVAENPYGSEVHHIRSRATGVKRLGSGVHIELESARTLEPDLAILAFGGQRPSPINVSSADVRSHPGYIGDPFDAEALESIPTNNKVLLIGTGLTSADVLATLSRRGHRGAITAISRRGLLPEPQGAPPDVAALMQRLSRPVPRFIERHGEGLTLRTALRLLRGDMAKARDEGGDLKGPFDDARDAAAWLWRGFTTEEKRRFLRHLKPWYDVNRYRMVPQTGATLAAMTTSGQLVYRVVRLANLDVQNDRLVAHLAERDGTVGKQSFDTVINCTGPKTLSNDSFLADLCDLGLARPDALDLGLDVDEEGRVLDLDGKAQDTLWAFGLLTRGRFGDITAIPQISFRIDRSLPALVRAVAGANGAL